MFRTRRAGVRAGWSFPCVFTCAVCVRNKRSSRSPSCCCYSTIGRWAGWPPGGSVQQRTASPQANRIVHRFRFALGTGIAAGRKDPLLRPERRVLCRRGNRSIARRSDAVTRGGAAGYAAVERSRRLPALCSKGCIPNDSRRLLPASRVGVGYGRRGDFGRLSGGNHRFSRSECPTTALPDRGLAVVSGDPCADDRPGSAQRTANGRPVHLFAAAGLLRCDRLAGRLAGHAVANAPRSRCGDCEPGPHRLWSGWIRTSWLLA